MDLTTSPRPRRLGLTAETNVKPTPLPVGVNDLFQMASRLPHAGSDGVEPWVGAGPYLDTFVKTDGE